MTSKNYEPTIKLLDICKDIAYLSQDDKVALAETLDDNYINFDRVDIIGHIDEIKYGGIYLLGNLLIAIAVDDTDPRDLEGDLGKVYMLNNDDENLPQDIKLESVHIIGYKNVDLMNPKHLKATVIQNVIKQGDEVEAYYPLSYLDFRSGEVRLDIVYDYENYSCNGCVFVTKKGLEKSGIAMGDVHKTLEAEIKLYEDYLNGGLYQVDIYNPATGSQYSHSLMTWTEVEELIKDKHNQQN